MPSWRNYFTTRELTEIDFSVLYAKEFNHGTDGHNAKIIIAKLVNLLESNAISEFPPFVTAEKKKEPGIYPAPTPVVLNDLDPTRFQVVNVYVESGEQGIGFKFPEGTTIEPPTSNP